MPEIGFRRKFRDLSAARQQATADVKPPSVPNPINVMLTPEEVRYVVEDNGARAVVTCSTGDVFVQC